MCDTRQYPMNGTRHGLAMNALPPSRPLPGAQQFQAPDNSNLYQNIVEAPGKQSMQLNRDVLMPAHWRQQNQRPATHAPQQNVDDCDFAKHTVTPLGYQTYLSTSGSARFGISGRNPIGKLGERNLLRMQAPVNVGNTNDIAWGDSEIRRSLSEGYGCAM